jgi:hypothetical protein
MLLAFMLLAARLPSRATALVKRQETAGVEADLSEKLSRVLSKYFVNQCLHKKKTGDEGIHVQSLPEPTEIESISEGCKPNCTIAIALCVCNLLSCSP